MSERFKVGDRVAAVKECTPYYNAGSVGTVYAVYDYDYQVYDYQVTFDDAPGVRVKVDGSTTWWVTELVAAPMTCKVSAHKAEYRARANDPATSKAAAKVNRTPLREQVYNVICGGHYEPRESGWTGHELAAVLKAPLNSITPRLAELRRGDKPRIKDSGTKRDKQIVWVLV